MSQSGFTPIQLYRSATAATLPVAGNLAAGELAINTTDEKLYFENTGGTVTLLASSAAAGGTFTTVTATTVVNGLGAVGTPSYTFTGDLNTGMWSPGSDTVAVSTAGSERLRIDSSGRLLVGIGSPIGISTVPVQSPGGFISANDAAGLRLLNSAQNGGGSVFSNTGSNGGISIGSDAGPMLFVSTTERMRITEAGNVGIGTTAPGANLEVSSTSAGATVEVLRLNNPGSGANTAAQIKFFAAGTNYASIAGGYGAAAAQMTFNMPTASAGNYVWQGNSVEQMRLDASGNLGIGTSAPVGPLHVYRAGGSSVRIDTDVNASSTQLNFATAGVSKWSMYRPGGSNDLRMFDNANVIDVMTWQAAGNVGIGTSAPGTKLDVTGSAIRVTNTTGYSGSSAVRFDIGASNDTSVDNSATYQWSMNTAGNASGQSLVFSAYRRADTTLERMRIDGNGNVGIGANVPAAKLTVINNAAYQLNVATGPSNYSNGGIVLGAFGTSDPNYFGAIQYDQSDQTTRIVNKSYSAVGGIDFYVGTTGTPASAMKLTSAGKLGIGTSAPNAQLVVAGVGAAGDIAGSRNTLYLKNANSSGNQSSVIIFGSAGSGGCGIYNDISANGTTVNRMDIYAGSGGGVFLGDGATAWASASDERGKDIIEPILNAVQKVGMLRAVIGKYKTDAEGTRRSFLIAQDVQAVLPEAVNVGTDEQQTLGVAYTDTIPLLVAAIKELTARVAQLEGNQP